MTARSATSWCGSNTPRPSRRPAGCAPTSTGNVDQYQPVADFITVAPELVRGQEVPFRLAYPLRSADRSVAGHREPRRLPGHGERQRHPRLRRRPPASTTRASCCRCSACRRTPARDATADDGLTPPCRRTSPDPVALTMFWPLADRPRLAAGAPGGTTPVRLIDDDLATSLATGGRLDTLLSAVDFATSPQVDPGGEVTSALCLAVDPDLLVTVNAMTGGYVVNDAPDAGPRPPRPIRAPASRPRSTGSTGSRRWRNACAWRRRPTRRPTSTRCTGSPTRGLSAIATNGAGDIVDQILGITSTRGASLRRRRAADRRPPCELLVGAGPDRGDRAPRTDRGPATPTAGQPETADTAAGALHAQRGRRAVRPDRRRGARRRGHRPRVAVLPGPVARHRGQTGLGGRPAPGRARLAAVARPAAPTSRRATRS